MKKLPARDALGTILIELAGDDSSGLLHIRNGDGEEKSFRFSRGELKDLSTPSKEKLPDRAIEGLLVATGREKILRRGQKVAQRSGVSITDAILRAEDVSLQEVAEAVKTAVVEEMAEAIAWEDPKVEIARDTRGFRGDLGDRFDLYVRLDELYIEAMRRLDRWEPVAATLPELREVYYATPSAGRLVADPDSYPDQIAILNQVDGRRMAREVIALTDLDPFEAFATLRGLVAEGDIVALSPVDLFQLGETTRREDPARGAAILERARERGLDDFDIQRRLAELYEEIGDAERALERYREFAEKCTAQFRLEDTIRAVEKIVALDPDDLEAREKFVSLLMKADRPADADAEILSFARVAAQCGKASRATRILARRLDGGEPTAELLEAAATLAEAAGDAATARARRQDIAGMCREAGDARKALEIYQKLFCDGHGDLDLRRKLVDLHIEVGDTAKAKEHLDSLLEGAAGLPISNAEILRELHRRRCEIHPGHRQSTWYLADDAAARGEKKEAADYLRTLARTLTDNDDAGERISALERIVEFDPEDLEASWDLAMALEMLTRGDEARVLLGKAARQAVRQGEFGHAEKCLRRVLRSTPLDPAAREEYLALAVERKDEVAADRRARDLIHLRRLAGDLPRALSLARERLGKDPADGFALLDLAASLSEEDDPKEAADLLVRAGKIFAATGNPGLARRCGEMLGKLDPSRPEAKELLHAAQPPSPPQAHTQAQPQPQPQPQGYVISTGPAASVATAAPAPGLPRITPGAEPVLGKGNEPLVKRVKLGSITARLKSFKSGGAPPVQTSDPSGSAESVSGSASQPAGGAKATEKSMDSAPQVRKAKLQGSASKLSALRNQAELTS
ncbi:MAG: hypothetical protein JXP34_28320 [Planctomycetes bacterium]|nr:hypothetical protein [Planctomycetota bacterium]